MARDREKYNAYQRDYQLRRYHERRKRYIKQLGGKCVDCESTENLEFDHADRVLKTFTISNSTWWSRAENILQEELKKCVLRCKPCHLKKTIDEMSVEHGGGKAGKHNCSCEPCKQRKREWTKEYYKTHVRKRDRQAPLAQPG